MAAMITVHQAESTVAAARFAELHAAQQAAWRRHSAARGRLTRARNSGDPARITAAELAERAAYHEADTAAGVRIEKMLDLNRARLDSLGVLLNQFGRVTAADSAALREMAAAAGDRAADGCLPAPSGVDRVEELAALPGSRAVHRRLRPVPGRRRRDVPGTRAAGAAPCGGGVAGRGAGPAARGGVRADTGGAEPGDLGAFPPGPAGAAVP
jgi:hypothetical protein